MVCNRCVLVVQKELERLGIAYTAVSLGEIQLIQELSAEQLKALKDSFDSIGFEILNSQKQKQIELIKTSLITLIQQAEMDEHFSLSHFLSATLNREYSYISRLFSEVEGITIEQYFILQKIEKTKELLVYNELSLSEIAWKLGYSSVAHLSAQFKKVTGLNPSAFKSTMGKRKPIDQIGN